MAHSAHLWVRDDVVEVFPAQRSTLQDDTSTFVRALSTEYQQLVPRTVCNQRAYLSEDEYIYQQ